MADTADQLFAYALARQSAGFSDEALAAYRRVIVLLPSAIAVFVNQAVALQALGRHDAALVSCRRAIDLAPLFAETHSKQGDVLREAGQPSPARHAYRTALVLAPGHAGTLNNLGTLLAALEERETAVLVLQHAVHLAPEHPQPHANLAAVELHLKRIAAAAASGRRAMVLDPAAAETMNNLGNALVEVERPEDAAALFRRAIVLRPDFTEARLNLSGALIDAGDAALGLALCRRAIVNEPARRDSYNNLGNALLIAGDLVASARVFRRALVLDPAEARLHYNFAAVLLKQGQLAEGWAEYEWRLRTKEALKTRELFARPSWDGGPLAGRTILLWAEQGLGDVLQFCRYAPLVAAQGGRVVLRVYPALVRLLNTLPGVAAVVPEGTPMPAHDCQLSLMSVPHRLGTRLDTIPRTSPYLSADPIAVALWRDRLAGLPGAKIGLVWAGDPRPHQRGAHLLDRRRSLTLAAFAGLAQVPGISLVSLQKGSAADQIKTPPAGLSLFDTAGDLHDFADTAAVIANLDLVIAADTSVAHLAGALGKDVWILSRFDGCWRWLEGRDDTPWYPTARLFRQTETGNWRPVLERLRASLTERIEQGRTR